MLTCCCNCHKRIVLPCRLPGASPRRALLHCMQMLFSYYMFSIQIRSNVRNKSISTTTPIKYTAQGAQQIIINYTARCATNHHQLNGTVRNNAWATTTSVKYTAHSAQQIIINYTARCATNHHQLDGTVRNNTLATTTSVKYAAHSCAQSCFLDWCCVWYWVVAHSAV